MLGVQKTERALPASTEAPLLDWESPDRLPRWVTVAIWPHAAIGDANAPTGAQCGAASWDLSLDGLGVRRLSLASVLNIYPGWVPLSSRGHVRRVFCAALRVSVRSGASVPTGGLRVAAHVSDAQGASDGGGALSAAANMVQGATGDGCVPIPRFAKEFRIVWGTGDNAAVSPDGVMPVITMGDLTGAVAGYDAEPVDFLTAWTPLPAQAAFVICSTAVGTYATVEFR